MNATSTAASPTAASTHRPWEDCHSISPFCPLEATVLGYYPNLGANIFFTIVFGINLLVATYFCVRYRTYTYSAALITGSLLECAGYVGRVLMHSNPWNQDAFQLQICAIVLAPTVVCISIYLTLKHVCLSLAPAEISRVKPRWYPFIFMPADVTCLLVQAIGGALAASGGYDNPKLTDGGNKAIIAGITLQVVVLGAFGIMLVDYFVRVRKFYANPENLATVEPDMLRHWEDKKFWLFVKVMWGAFTVIFIRCIYRIAEMAGGWGNHIMQDEISFIILDSCTMVVAVTLLTFFSPGYLFPSMAARMSLRFQKKEKRSGGSSTNPPTSAGEEEEAHETVPDKNESNRPVTEKAAEFTAS